MFGALLVLVEVLGAITTGYNILNSIQKGGRVMPEEKMKPEDLVALAITAGLNAIFTLWEKASAATDGNIPEWDALASKNARLQAKIDAEKQA
jgi:hypothetical protein